jgi:hypothetical protein
MFAMFENKEGVKGEIIGELVKSAPNVAVTINPNIKISSLSDFTKYRIGTFQEYSTTYNIAKYILPKETEIIPLDHKQILNKLVDRTIDIAIVLLEQALDLEALGGRIIFNFKDEFNKFLFTGFTISNILESKYKKKIKSFLVSVREAVRYIYKNKEEVYSTFVKLFPNIMQPKKVFEEYLKIWSTTINVEKDDYRNAYKAWNKNYPELLKIYLPYFRKTSIAESVIEKINSGNFRRDYPFLEDKLEERIISSIKQNKPLKLVGFWGASDKSLVKDDDLKTISYFKKYIENVKNALKREVEVTWILADEHAESNGYNKKNYNKYLVNIQSRLRQDGFKTIYLKDLWKKWGITHKTIRDSVKKKPTNWWSTINIATQLEEQAKGKSKAGNYILGAKKYYIMRKLEKKFIEKDFSDYTFFAFTDGRMQSIYPKLPTLYLYAQGKKNSVVPWFDKQ